MKVYGTQDMCQTKPYREKLCAHSSALTGNSKTNYILVETLQMKYNPADGENWECQKVGLIPLRYVRDRMVV